MENIALNLRRNNTYIWAAKVNKTFNKNVVFILRILLLISIFSLLALLLGNFSNPIKEMLPEFLLRVFLFLGSLAFFSLRFVNGFVGSLFKKSSLQKGNMTGLYEVSDPELINIFAKTGLETTKINVLFEEVLKSSRVKFILSELSIQPNDLSKITNGFAAQEGGANLINTVVNFAIENALNEKGDKITAADILFGICVGMVYLFTFV